MTERPGLYMIVILILLNIIGVGVIIVMEPEVDIQREAWCSFYAERIDRLSVEEEWLYRHRCFKK